MAGGITGALLGILLILSILIWKANTLYLGRGRLIMLLLAPVCFCILGWALSRWIVRIEETVRLKFYQRKSDSEYYMAQMKYQLELRRHMRMLEKREKCQEIGRIAKNDLKVIIQKEIGTMNEITPFDADELCWCIGMALEEIDKLVLAEFQMVMNNKV